jgi:hypothetical protein
MVTASPRSKSGADKKPRSEIQAGLLLGGGGQTSGCTAAIMSTSIAAFFGN